jgi:hypothetical protein
MKAALVNGDKVRYDAIYISYTSILLKCLIHAINNMSYGIAWSGVGGQEL